MQTAWIRMLHRVTRPLIWIQAVWHSDNIFTTFEPHWSTLKIDAERKLSRRQLIWPAKGSRHFGNYTFVWNRTNYCNYNRVTVNSTKLYCLIKLSLKFLHFVKSKGHKSVYCKTKFFACHPQPPLLTCHWGFLLALDQRTCICRFYTASSALHCSMLFSWSSSRLFRTFCDKSCHKSKQAIDY